ncbi:MAG: hypothetical protein EBT07_14420 [Actinobacteria bacterium]|nr:hypothetical protein [Actinomycetota bacterium]
MAAEVELEVMEVVEVVLVVTELDRHQYQLLRDLIQLLLVVVAILYLVVELEQMVVQVLHLVLHPMVVVEVVEVPQLFPTPTELLEVLVAVVRILVLVEMVIVHQQVHPKDLMVLKEHKQLEHLYLMIKEVVVEGQEVLEVLPQVVLVPVLVVLEDLGLLMFMLMVHQIHKFMRAVGVVLVMTVHLELLLLPVEVVMVQELVPHYLAVMELILLAVVVVPVMVEEVLQDLVVPES